eukprot:gene10919-7767_t
MSDSNNNSNIYGTPSKKKRNELHDANDVRFQSPIHITSVTGVGAGAANTVFGSPEVGTFMSVFMSPLTQYQQTVPDSKDWTPGIQHKLAHESFLNFPDAVTPGALPGNGHRHSLSNLHLRNELSLSMGLGAPPSGGVSTSASMSLMSPLIPELLDQQHHSGSDFGSDAYGSSLLGSNAGALAGPGLGMNSNHFAQNAEALKNRLNKRKSASSSSTDNLQLSALEDRSATFAAPAAVSSSSSSSKADAAGGNFGASSQGTTSSDISGIAAITAAAAFMPMSASNSLETSPDDKLRAAAAPTATTTAPGSSKRKSSAKRQQSSTPSQVASSGAVLLSPLAANKRPAKDAQRGERMQDDESDDQDGDDFQDPYARPAAQSTDGAAPFGQFALAPSSSSAYSAAASSSTTARSFMSPEMRELSMRTTPSSSSRSGAGAPSGASNNVACNCKKSKCLKMYCDCFRLSEYCKASCNCVECCNIEKFEHVRLAARKAIQDRNPEAFKPRVKEEMKEHLTGCHCRKSACLKKYCECYTGKVPCSSRCRCVDCQNVPQLYAKSGGGALTGAKSQSSARLTSTGTTTSDGGLSIEIPGGGNGKPPAVFHVTQSPELRDLARKGQQQVRDVGGASHPALDTLTSVQSAKPLGTFSAPQSPLRTTGGTISAVVSPKLLELAELCGPDDHDGGQPSRSSRVIAFPTRLLVSQEEDDTDSAPISRSGTSTSTNG